MTTLRGLGSSYRDAHRDPADLILAEADGLGINVSAAADELAARYRNTHLWWALARQLRGSIAGYLLPTFAVIALAPLVPRALGRAVTLLGAGGGTGVVSSAVWLSLLVAGYGALRWVALWRVRLLIYQITAVLERMVFRRLQVTDPRWLDEQKISVNAYLTGNVQRLSQLAFGVRMLGELGLVAVLAVMLVLWYGWVGVGVLVAVAVVSVGLQVLVGRAVRVGQRYFDTDHERTRLVDLIASSWQSIRRQSLEPQILTAMDAIRRRQRRIWHRFGLLDGTAAAITASLTPLVSLAAVGTALLAGTAIPVGEALALLVVVRMLIAAVAACLSDYEQLAVAATVTSDLDTLFHIAPTIGPDTTTSPAGTIGLGPDLSISPGERIAVLGPAATQVLVTVAGAPGDQRVRRSGSAVLVRRGQPTPTGSIAETVTLWDRHVQADRYRRAVCDSGLAVDLATRAGGDDSPLSDAESRFSDGQIVRLSLAQALYAAPDVLLLDDVFAPLDPERAHQVAATVLAPGPERGTRLFTTTRLEIARHADRYLIATDTDLLLVTADDLADPTHAAAAEHLLGEPAVRALLAALCQSEPTSAVICRADHSIASRAGAQDVSVDRTAFEASPVPPRGGMLANAAALFSPAACVALAFAVAAAVLLDIAFAETISAGFTTAPLVLAGLAAAGTSVLWLQRLLAYQAPDAAIERTHRALLARILGGHVDEQMPTVSGRLGADFGQLQTRAAGVCLILAVGITQILAALILVTVTEPWTILPLTVVAGWAGWSYRSGKRALIAASRLQTALRGPRQGLARTAIGTPAFHYSTPLRAGLSRRFDDLADLSIVAARASLLIHLRIQASIEAAATGVFLIALWAAVTWRHSWALAAGVIVYLVYDFSRQIVALVERSQGMDSVVIQLTRLAALFGQRALPTHHALRVQVPDGLEELYEQILTPEPDTATVAVTLTDVRLDVGAEQRQLVPLTMTFDPGAFTVITGASGIGKSTLLRTIAGAQPPREGEVRVNGHAPHALGASTRRWLAYLDSDTPQVPVTVQEFLDPWGQGGHDHLEAVFTAAGRPIPDPGTPIADLDHPGRQLTNLARALQARPVVLLLDEATSALDPTAERGVLEYLSRYMAGKIVLIVLHRTDNQDLAGDTLALAADPALPGPRSAESRRGWVASLG